MTELAATRLSRYATVVVFAMTALFFSGYAYTGVELGLSIVRPWMWLFVFAGLTIPMNLSLIRKRLTITPILVWAYCLLAVMILWSVIAPSPAAAIDKIIAFGLFMATVILAMTMLRTEAARRVAAKAVFLVVIGSAVTNLVMASMGTNRPSGLYSNPNTSGYALVMGMIVTHLFVPPKYRFLYQIFVLAGVFVTESRASLILWAVSVILIYVLNREKQHQNRWVVGTMVVLGLVALSPVGGNLLDNMGDSSGEESRLLSLGSREELKDDSRVELVNLAIDEIREHPILGQGTGKATVIQDNKEFGTHNMYLAMMMQFGVLGVVVMPALALIVLGRSSSRWQFSVPFAVLLIIASFFNHNLLDQWHFGYLLALVCVMTGTEFAPAFARERSDRQQVPRFALT
jgi:hypothetical protein